MELLGPTGTYILIVALASFAVGVHAYSLYGQRAPTEKEGAPRDPLSALALPTVAGQAAFRRGFAAYLIANEVLFLLLISSSIILELSLQAIGKGELVGALSSSGNLNPIVPILASTVVITASQLKPLSQIERSIRSVSHRIAGIPRNLDSVQEQIRLTSIRELEQTIREDTSDPRALENSLRLITNADKQAQRVFRAALEAGLGEFEADNLRTSLRRVHCLYEWTLGYDGDQIWIGDDVKQITSLFHSLKLEFRNVRDRITKLRAENLPNGQDNGSSLIELWEKVVSDSLMLERHLTVVLSLLLINKPDVELQKYPALSFLRDRTVAEATGTDRRARNALGLSILVGSFTAFICMIGYLSVEKTVRDWDRTEAARLQSQGPFGEPAAEFGASDWLQYLSARMDDAFFETLDFTLIFTISVLIALVMRDALLVQKRWPRIQQHDVAPVASYLYVGLLAYLPSVLMFLVLKFVMLMIVQPLSAGTQILDPISMKTFPGYLPEILHVPAIAFVCVWFTCNYLDQKLFQQKRLAPTALKFALLCGAVIFLLASLRIRNFEFDDALASFFIPSIVLYTLFSVFCRTYRKQFLAQTNQTRGHVPWWTLLRRKGSHHRQSAASADPGKTSGAGVQSNAEDPAEIIS